MKAFLVIPAMLLVSSRNSEGFVPSLPLPTNSNVGNALQMAANGHNNDSHDNNNNNNNNHLEQTRKQLEALLLVSNDNDSTGKSHQTSNNSPPNMDRKEWVQRLSHPPLRKADSTVDWDALLPPPPPLTVGARDRRLVELQLLAELSHEHHGDTVRHELERFWYAQEGTQAQERLAHADELMASGLVIASEQILITLLQDYNIHHWVEPLHRLATLYGLQGKLEESYHLLQCVLHVKAWHVGALDDMMEVCLATRRRDEARLWATRRLPNLVASTSFPPFITEGPVNPERVRWTEQAVQQAQEALAHLEHQTQRDFLGRPEAYYSSSTQQQQKKEQTTNSGDTGTATPEEVSADLDYDFGAWE